MQEETKKPKTMNVLEKVRNYYSSGLLLLHSLLLAGGLCGYAFYHDIIKCEWLNDSPRLSRQVARISQMEREMGEEGQISLDYRGRKISLRNGAKREGETTYSYLEMRVNGGENKIVFWDHNADGLGDLIVETRSGDRIWINGNRTNLAEIGGRNQDLADKLKKFYDSACTHSYELLESREGETRTRYTQFRENLDQEMCNTLSDLPSK